MRIGCAGCRLHLRVGRILVPDLDVGLDRVVEEKDVLQDQPDRTMNEIERQLAQVDTAEPNRTLLRVPEAGDQVRNRCLPGTARAHEREHGAFLQVDRYVVQHRPSGFIGEGHMIERDVVSRVPGNPRRRRLLHLDRRVQNLKDSIGGGFGVAQALELAIELGDRPVELGRQKDEQHQVRDAELA